MRSLRIDLTRDEALEVVYLVAQLLQAVQPTGPYQQLLYLHLSKLYTRLFTRTPFLKPHNRIAFRTEEALVLTLLLGEHPVLELPEDSFAGHVATRLLTEFHQRLA